MDASTLFFRTFINAQINRRIRAISNEPVTESSEACAGRNFLSGRRTNQAEGCRQCEEQNIATITSLLRDISLKTRSKHCLSQFWCNALFFPGKEAALALFVGENSSEQSDAHSV